MWTTKGYFLRLNVHTKSKEFYIHSTVKTLSSLCYAVLVHNPIINILQVESNVEANISKAMLFWKLVFIELVLSRHKILQMTSNLYTG